MNLIPGLFQLTGQLVLVLVIGAYLYLLPGWPWLSLFRIPADTPFPTRIALAVAITLSLYPLLLLWGEPLPWPVLPFVTWAPGFLGLLWLLYRARSLSPPSAGWRKAVHPLLSLDAIALAGTLLLVLAVRLAAVRGLPAPSWGDSVHHTVISQLMLENGGLFQSWEPYAPLLSFTYHFGFHTAVALWRSLTGQVAPLQAPQAMLEAAQVLNALSVLALLPLAIRLSGRNRWAGIAAVLVGGLLSPMPAFYINWGRFTQMAGQILFPVLLWAFDVWWTEEKRPSRAFLGLIALLAAGLALTHYRVAAVAAVTGVAWILWGLWCHRRALREWTTRLGLLMLPTLAAGLAILPWALRIRTGRLGTVATAIGTYSDSRYAAFMADLQQWTGISHHYPQWLWIGALIALGIALVRARRLAVPWLISAPLIFLATNPFLFHLPGTGWISNFLVIIGAYIPMALFGGWLLGAVTRWILAQSRWGVLAVLALWLPLLGWGSWRQLHIVDPFFQMVTWNDVEAFAWIREETPEGARFLVNGFLAYNGTVAVGSDAGWWLRFYTLRDTNLPPTMIYVAEREPYPGYRDQVRRLILEVAATQGEEQALVSVLCRNQITHIYLGEKRGRVGYGAEPLVPESWLRDRAAFELRHQEGMAQVWALSDVTCELTP